MVWMENKRITSASVSSNGDPGEEKTIENSNAILASFFFLKTQTQSKAIINCTLLKTGQNSVKHSTNFKRESQSVDKASNKELPIHWITWHACGSLSIPFTIGSSERYFIVRLLLPFLVYPSFISFNFSTTLCLYLHHKQTENIHSLRWEYKQFQFLFWI